MSRHSVQHSVGSFIPTVMAASAAKPALSSSSSTRTMSGRRRIPATVRAAKPALPVGLTIPAATSGSRMVGQYKVAESADTRPRNARLTWCWASVAEAAETKTLASIVSISGAARRQRQLPRGLPAKPCRFLLTTPATAFPILHRLAAVVLLPVPVPRPASFQEFLLCNGYAAEHCRAVPL